MGYVENVLYCQLKINKVTTEFVSLKAHSISQCIEIPFRNTEK